MKTFTKVPVYQDELVSITCDACKTTYEAHDVMEIQEFLHVRFGAGYGSVFGDTNVIAGDICQHCVKERLGDALRVVDNYMRPMTDEEMTEAISAARVNEEQ